MSMRTLQSTTLRKNFFQVLDRIEEERQPLEILRHGKPVAVLAPSAGLPPGRKKPAIPLDEIAQFCRQFHVLALFLFGSILGDDFDETSDIDVLVDTRGRHLKFKEECRMLDTLEAMFGRKVDLLTKDALESPSMNPHLKASISSTVRLVHLEAA